jgi:hypothetical protein
MQTERLRPRTDGPKLVLVKPREAATPPPRRIEAALPLVPAALGVTALALGIVGLAGVGPAFLRRRPVLSGAIALAGVLGLLERPLDRFLDARAGYAMEGHIGPLEIRFYEPGVIAKSAAEHLAPLSGPGDPRVKVWKLRGERVAALRFRGTFDGARILDKQAELLRRIGEAGLEPAGPVVFMGEASPARLPFLRRLEVLVPLA